MPPDQNGDFKGISVPRIPYREDPKEETAQAESLRDFKEKPPSQPPEDEPAPEEARQ